MKINTTGKLVIAIGISELVGLIGSFFTRMGNSDWYAILQKPAFNPPSWVFAPVWIVLYALMGIAAGLIWQKENKRKEVEKALRMFGIQLLLNALWSIVFFGGQSPFFALVVIVALWIAIIKTIIAFNAISRTAAYLLVPYILWVSFAVYLNYSIWILN